jgi:hypothetical protein
VNAIKDSIKSGRTVVGTTGAPNVDVSILADAGYDLVLFDSQHSPWEIKQLQPSIQAMRGKQAAPLVRIREGIRIYGGTQNAHRLRTSGRWNFRCARRNFALCRDAKSQS